MLVRFLVLFLIFFHSLSFSNETKKNIEFTPRKWSFSEVGKIPLQSGGRVKPLDSFAREAVLFITGKRKYDGLHPVEFVLSVLTFPEYWSDKQIIEIRRADVKKQILLPLERTKFSPKELFENSVLGQYAVAMGSGSSGQVLRPGELKMNPREDALKQVVQKLMVFRQLISGEAWRVLPEQPPAAWESLEKLRAPEGISPGSIEENYKNIMTSYYLSDEALFQKSAEKLNSLVSDFIEQSKVGSLKKVQAEYYYNNIRPYQLSWIFYLFSGLLMLFSFVLTREKLGTVGFIAFLGMFCGFVLQVTGLSFRAYIAGRPPVSNMYETVVWVAFGILFFAFILYYFNRKKILLITSSILAALMILAGDSAPAVMDPSIQPLVPVLRSNLWLTIHVLTITISYSAFAITFGLSLVVLFHYIRSRGRLEPIVEQVQNINLLSYRAMQIGVVLLAAGTILGGVWADYSWGRFWGWDPKEVWALIALLAYLAVLHGRFTGWVGSFAYATCTAFSFLTIIMAWYGVNFVLGVGLHSYGFSAGGVEYVSGFCGLVTLFILYAIYIHWRAKKNVLK